MSVGMGAPGGPVLLNLLQQQKLRLHGSVVVPNITEPSDVHLTGVQTGFQAPPPETHLRSHSSDANLLWKA